MNCGKLIKTLDNILPCVCEEGHEGGCNPFSPNPNVNKKPDSPPRPQPRIPRDPAHSERD
jgi:hypothetical protein